MEKRLFTLEETNNIIPEISPKLEKIVDKTARVNLVTEALQYAQLNPNKTAENTKNLEEKLNELSFEIKEMIRDVQRCGCVVKDVEKGIVDFYSMKNNELVFLCWKLGENKIKYWHTIHSGFVRRVPISSLEEPKK